MSLQATIDKHGVLKISGETSIEEFALSKWEEMEGKVEVLTGDKSKGIGFNREKKDKKK